MARTPRMTVGAIAKAPRRRSSAGLPPQRFVPTMNSERKRGREEEDQQEEARAATALERSRGGSGKEGQKRRAGKRARRSLNSSPPSSPPRIGGRSAAAKRRSAKKPGGSPRAPRVVLPRTRPIPPSGPAAASAATACGLTPDSHGVLLGYRIVRSFPVPYVGPDGATSRTDDVLFLGTVVDYCPVPPGLTVDDDRSRRCRLKAGGLDIGLYRVRFDDGDTMDMDPNEAYQGFLDYQEQRSYRRVPRMTVQRAPPIRKEVMATDANAPDGTEATAEAGERELNRHANKRLNREALLELDREKLGYWEYFREFNERTGVERPEPLVHVHQPDAETGFPVYGGHSDVSGAATGSSPLHSQSGKSKVMPRHMPGPGGNDRTVMHFRVTSGPASVPMPQIADLDQTSSPDTDTGKGWFGFGKKSPLRQTSSQTPGEVPGRDAGRPNPADDDSYATADEFEPSEAGEECSRTSGGATEGGSVESKAANMGGKSEKRKRDAGQDDNGVERHPIRRRTENSADDGNDNESQEDNNSNGDRIKRVRVKYEEGSRSGLLRRVWRAIFLE